MNVAMELAQGDYVLFLEDDNFLTESNSLEIMVDTLEKNEASFTYGDCWFQPQVGNKALRNMDLFSFFKFIFVPLCSILCDLRTIKEIACFDDNFEYSGDYSFTLQLFLSGKKGCELPSALSAFHLHQKTLDEMLSHNRLIGKETIQQAKNFFTEIEGVTEAQLDEMTTTGKVPNSFLDIVTAGAHPFFKQALNKIVDTYVHKFDEFIEFDKMGFKKIYIPLCGMGDGLMFATVAHKLFEQTGQKILVAHKNKELFENNPYIVVTNAIYDHPGHLSLEDIDFLKKINFEIVFVTIWLSHQVDNKKFNFTYPKQPLIAQLASRCGIDDVIELKPEIYLTNEEKAFGRFFPKDRKQIAIMSSALSPRKQYPYFQQIVDALKDEYDFVQIGAKEDHLLSGVKENMAGKLTLRQTAGVLYNSDLFVGEIGGLMHMARAVDCPAVIAFSGSEPEKFVHYICNINVGPKKTCKLAIKGLTNKDCDPCINKHPYCCVNTIPVEKMIKAIRKQLKRGKENLPVQVVRVKPDFMKNSINEYLRRYNNIFNLDNL